MQPAAVFPLHDPEGLLLPHLDAITPVLKQNFAQVYLAVSGSTWDRKPENIGRLQMDRFFHIFLQDGDGPVGDRFTSLYRQAVLASPPEQVLHLCSLDRLAFALRTEHGSRFLADLHAVRAGDLPLIFQRSEKAWQTHPQNYYEIERFVTTLGKILFGKTLDYAWCHLVLRASTLAEILPAVKNHDLSMMAEIVLQLQADIRTREVDWLAWEDPFILGRDPDELKREREASLEEAQKRLAYVLPMVEALLRYSRQQNGQE
jgi:hypothetical protein